jgi:DNA-binding XRE family transcriptional regulator
MIADYYLFRLKRFEQGLSQVDLAEKAGVSVKTVVSAEKGRSIHPRTNRALRDALGLE